MLRQGPSFFRSSLWPPSSAQCLHITNTQLRHCWMVTQRMGNWRPSPECSMFSSWVTPTHSPSLPLKHRLLCMCLLLTSNFPIVQNTNVKSTPGCFVVGYTHVHHQAGENRCSIFSTPNRLPQYHLLLVLTISSSFFVCLFLCFLLLAMWKRFWIRQRLHKQICFLITESKHL